MILKLELQTNSWPGINIPSLCWCVTQQHRFELVWNGGEKHAAFVFLVRGYGTAYMLMYAGGMYPGAPGCSVFCCSLLWLLLYPRSAFEELHQGQPVLLANALEEGPLCFLAWSLIVFYNQLY